MPQPSELTTLVEKIQQHDDIIQFIREICAIPSLNSLIGPVGEFSDWEMRGAPLRIEVGPKDAEKGTVVFARRDLPGKEGKSFVPQAGDRRNSPIGVGDDPVRAAMRGGDLRKRPKRPRAAFHWINPADRACAFTAASLRVK
jgi:hypothetical protein